MTRLEFSIAWRYLRSRRGSRLLSLISVIAIGGVLVGVSALIVIMGVMNGLQHDLREKILVGSADIQVLPYGAGLRLSNWRAVRDKVRKKAGRKKSPSAAIIDSQTVKTTEKRGSVGTTRARRSAAASGTSSSIRSA